MAEKSTDEKSGLDDSISGEFPENSDNGDKVQNSADGDTDSVPKKMRMQTPSPGPEPFMVQRKIYKFLTLIFH